MGELALPLRVLFFSLKMPGLRRLELAFFEVRVLDLTMLDISMLGFGFGHVRHLHVVHVVVTFFQIYVYYVCCFKHVLINCINGKCVGQFLDFYLLYL